MSAAAASGSHTSSSSSTSSNNSSNNSNSSNSNDNKNSNNMVFCWGRVRGCCFILLILSLTLLIQERDLSSSLTKPKVFPKSLSQSTVGEGGQSQDELTETETATTLIKGTDQVETGTRTKTQTQTEAENENETETEIEIENESNTNNKTTTKPKTSLSIAEEVDTLFPDVGPEDDPRVTAVYSKEAVTQLARIMDKMKHKQNLTIMVNGGSASAGAPNVKHRHRMFVQFARRLGRQYYDNEASDAIWIVDRAHGSRNSLHSAHLMPSFMPREHVDILIWEFAINDYLTPVEVRDQLIQWLRNVEASQPKQPPLVLLAYLWDTPFARSSQGRIRSRVFTAHQELAAEYDFVLGHVNLAAYFDDLAAADSGWTTDALRKHFLADLHHPRQRGHVLLGKLLYQLLSKADLYTPRRNTLPFPPSKRTELSWTCGTETPEQQALKRVYDTTRGIVWASYTTDLPRNLKHDSLLVPANPTGRNIVDIGKSKRGRSDRQRAIVLPCCTSSADGSTTTVDFNIMAPTSNSTWPREQPLLVHALELTLKCSSRERSLDLRVYFDKEKDGTKQLLRPMEDWGCFLGGNNGHYAPVDVDYILVNQATLSTIRFCDSACSATALENDTLAMISISIL